MAMTNDAVMAASVQRIRADEGVVLRSVRLAALADAPHAFGSTLAAELLCTDADWESRAQRGAQGGLRATFFARDGDEVVGLVGGHRAHAESPDVELVSMWTAPHARRRGVGRALVQAVIDWAVATAATSVQLWVTRGNDAAQSLYAELGFRETGEFQPLPSDPCKDEIRMTWTKGTTPAAG